MEGKAGVIVVMAGFENIDSSIGITSACRLFSFPCQYDLDAVKHDLEIESEGYIFYVQQVEGHSLYHFFHRGSVTEFDHAPTGQSGFYLEQVFIFRVLYDDLVDVVLPFGSRAHEAHLTHQDIP